MAGYQRFCTAACVLVGTILAIVVRAEGVDIISPQQAETLYRDGAQFVDTRSWAEVQFGMVKNSLHIPHGDIADQAAELLVNKAQPLVLYCAAGGRAGKAAAELTELGYTNVKVVGDGTGFKELRSAGVPVNN